MHSLIRYRIFDNAAYDLVDGLSEFLTETRTPCLVPFAHFIEQQTLPVLHRVRTQWQATRTARINVMRHGRPLRKSNRDSGLSCFLANKGGKM